MKVHADDLMDQTARYKNSQSLSYIYLKKQDFFSEPQRLLSIIKYNLSVFRVAKVIHRSVLTEVNSVTEFRTALMEQMRRRLAVSII